MMMNNDQETKENKTMKNKVSMTPEQFDELDSLISRAAECVDKTYEATMSPESAAIFWNLEADEAFDKIGKLLKDVKNNCTNEISNESINEGNDDE
jgi:hypothetical protein